MESCFLSHCKYTVPNHLAHLCISAEIKWQEQSSKLARQASGRKELTVNECIPIPLSKRQADIKTLVLDWKDLTVCENSRGNISSSTAHWFACVFSSVLTPGLPSKMNASLSFEMVTSISVIITGGGYFCPSALDNRTGNRVSRDHAASWRLHPSVHAIFLLHSLGGGLVITQSCWQYCPVV